MYLVLADCSQAMMMQIKYSIHYKMPNNKKQLLEQLPQEFQRKEAVAIGKKLGLSERSVDDFLNNSVPILLVKPKTGHYRKIANN